MSSSLCWEPLSPPRSKSLSDQLKYIFGPAYWDHDGTCNGEPITLNLDSLEYLFGIRDGSMDAEVKRDVRILIEAIEKYGAVNIWIEN